MMAQGHSKGTKSNLGIKIRHSRYKSKNNTGLHHIRTHSSNDFKDYFYWLYLFLA